MESTVYWNSTPMSYHHRILNTLLNRHVTTKLRDRQEKFGNLGAASTSYARMWSDAPPSLSLENRCASTIELIQVCNPYVAFYGTVLDVKLETLPSPVDGIEMMSFPMAMEVTGAAGALVKMEGFKPGLGGTLIYFVCDDCATEAARVQAAGGRIKQPKTSIGEYGFMVLAVDTEGNMFGLHSQQ